MKLSEAIKICTATGLEGWEQVEYVIGFVRTHMEYSLSNAHMTHRAAFRAGRGYCVQQAMCVRDILRASGFVVCPVYCRQVFVPDRNLTIGHTWCRVTYDGEIKNVCTCGSDNVPGHFSFIPQSPVKKYTGPVIIGGYLGSLLMGHNQNKSKKHLTGTSDCEKRQR